MILGHGADAGDREPRRWSSARQILGTLVERAEALARLVHRFEAAVEAGLTEWADVTQVARGGGCGHDRVIVEAAPRARPWRASTAPRRARILEELVENALAFSPRPTPGHDPRHAARRRAEVRVIDGGPGIEAESVPRIFDPLEQGEDLNTRVHQGVGLGLTLARMSARAMDGDVILESTGPRGVDVPVDRVPPSPRRR